MNDLFLNSKLKAIFAHEIMFIVSCGATGTVRWW